MKGFHILVAVGLLAALIGAPPASAGSAVSIGIYSIAACKDETTVVVNGSSTYSNNRLDVGVYYKNDKGQYVLLKQAYTFAFGAGSFMLAVPLAHPESGTAEGETLRVDVQLQYLSGNSYVDVGPLLIRHVTVADKYCIGKCTVTVDTADKAPASGTLTLRSHFGQWFRPEGRLHGAVPVSAGQKVRAVFVGLPCGWAVRAWYYPKSGDKTPKMLPSQYWPNEFAANSLDGTNPYTTAFVKGLKATHPPEPDDPFITK